MSNHETQLQELERLRARVSELEADLDPAVVSIAENSPNNIMLLDVEARIRYINRTVPDLTREQVIGRRVQEFVPAAFHADMQSCFDRVLETRQPDRYTTWYVAEDGEKSYWESSVGAVVRDGRVQAFAVISTNVTEQLRDAEERERFFKLSVDMLCVANFDGYFKRVNPAFGSTLGYDLAELLNRPFVAFIHPADVKATEDAVARLVKGEIIVDFENRYRRKDGAYRVFSWRAVGDAARRSIYAVARDVTERNNLEEQLRQSQKMDAIGQLAGGVAHDFNNLLQAVEGNIAFAQRTDSPEEMAEVLSEAMQAAQRAAELTKQLLTFGRRQLMHPLPLQLSALTHDMMKLLRRLIPESIDVTLIRGDEVAAIVADKSQLEQVLVNLCVNSRDAMPGGGRITIETANVAMSAEHVATFPEARPGKYVMLSVSDTGTGMAAEVQQHLFEPFYTTKEQGRGTGLGLATVYGIVQRHGGFLRVHSELGKGSTFRAYFPATDRPAVDVGHTPETPAVGGKETILIAEDEDTVRSVLVRALTGAGYEVVVAKDGVEAVRAFKQHASVVSLVILDVIMPKLNGADAAALIRDARPGVPVLFMSGYATTVLAKDETENLLQKPFEPDRLLHVVRRLLDEITDTGGSQFPKPSSRS